MSREPIDSYNYKIRILHKHWNIQYIVKYTVCETVWLLTHTAYISSWSFIPF